MSLAVNDWKSGIERIFREQMRISDKALQAMLQLWNRERQLKRLEFLAAPGQTETNLYYVIEGSMRIYFPHEDDEICVGFSYTDSLICSYPSFIQQKPSQYYIQALSKTRLVAIGRAEFYRLFDQHPDIERCWRMLEEHALLGKIEREREMLTYSPEERYRRLLERSPRIFQIIPRKYIASYLRMTPETLSRLGSV